MRDFTTTKCLRPTLTDGSQAPSPETTGWNPGGWRPGDRVYWTKHGEFGHVVRAFMLEPCKEPKVEIDTSVDGHTITWFVNPDELEDAPTIYPRGQ